MTARVLVRTAVLLALPIAVAGCAAAPADVAVESSGGAAAVAGAEPVRPAETVLTLPLDAYALTAAEDHVLARAAEAHVRHCATSLGLDAAAVDPLPFGTAAESASAAAGRHDRRYAVADPEVAAAHGYHPPSTTDVRREFYEAHTDAELAILVGATADGVPTAREGIPDGGCLGAAARATAVADEAALRAGQELVSAVQSDAWHAALANPRVLDAFAAWSACMAEAGYDYAAPMDANDDPRWWTSDVAGPEEIATAVADVACKESTGLIAVWSAVEAGHQSRLIAASRAELDAYRALLDAQVSAASTAR
ncbi:hypothetical protein [Jiangella rhizosphaerae]|uniref:DUF4439 domain-containing protein n=1 Tax=Jiangella rhizosphaerae TaxID=2293569 RepID=A0A418KRD2_9ACTN|nr:hypothetical protein [Jiangella rhizosphaerae]RIQ23270.1 hypothetical protein DY240_12635 [Jiangella rhizosphaerae]